MKALTPVFFRHEKMNIELDPIDLKIIALLKQDSRLTNKEIGQRVHRTGQAVGARIAQLMDAGFH